MKGETITAIAKYVREFRTLRKYCTSLTCENDTRAMADSISCKTKGKNLQEEWPCGFFQTEK